MTKKTSILWIMMFLIVITVPSATYPFLKKYVDNENYENRTKVEKPALSMENYNSFPMEFENYYNDNIPYRNQLITLNNSIDYFVFQQSDNNAVLIGKDDWLFYCSEDDGNPVKQSLGYWKYTDKQLEEITGNLLVTKNILESRGIEFVLFIAPNKETVYYDKVPDCYEVIDKENSTMQLITYLKENTDIRIVYPLQNLMKARENYQNIVFYRQTDTHWNRAGAYIGAVCLAEELGITMPPFEAISLTAVIPPKGDLANMLNISWLKEDNDYDLEQISKQKTISEKWGDYDTEFLFHTEGADERNIFVMGDSFSGAMSSSLATQFENSIFMHKNSFDQKQIFEYRMDIFVLETVERYLPELERFRISYVEAWVEDNNERKSIKIDATFPEDKPQYVSIEKVEEQTGERIEIQKNKLLTEEIYISVPKEEKGEIFISVYSDCEGKKLLEKRVLSY